MILTELSDYYIGKQCELYTNLAHSKGDVEFYLRIFD